MAAIAKVLLGMDSAVKILRKVSTCAGGKISDMTASMGWDPERMVNEVKNFAKEHPVIFICTASVGAFSIVPVGMFLTFMVFTLATAFITFVVVAVSVIGFGAFMLAVALIVMACLALPVALFLATFYLGTSAFLKLSASGLVVVQSILGNGSKNEGVIPLIPGQGGSNVVELPEYMQKGQGDSRPQGQGRPNPTG